MIYLQVFCGLFFLVWVVVAIFHTPKSKTGLDRLVSECAACAWQLTDNNKLRSQLSLAEKVVETASKIQALMDGTLKDTESGWARNMYANQLFALQRQAIAAYEAVKGKT